MPEAAANEFTGFITAQDVFTAPIDPDHLSVLSGYFHHWAFLVSMPIGQVDAIWNIWKDSVKANESTVGTSDEETTSGGAQPEGNATG